MDKQYALLSEKEGYFEEAADEISSWFENIAGGNTPNSNVLSDDDCLTFLSFVCKNQGINTHHIESFNDFLDYLKTIITKGFQINVENMKNKRDKTDEDKRIDSISFSVQFTDAYVKPPETIKYLSGTATALYPNAARKNNLTYSATLYISAIITAKATTTQGMEIEKKPYHIKDWRISNLPIQPKCKMCNCVDLPQDALKRLEEDPLDEGGYFIIKGGEWMVDSLENTTINHPHIYRNNYQGEISRCEFISKPGDYFENSMQIKLKYLKNDALVLELVTGKGTQLRMPFYIIYRAFGMMSDKEILKTIIYDVESQDPISIYMTNIIEKAFKVAEANSPYNEIMYSRDMQRIIDVLGKQLFTINIKETKKTQKYLFNNAMKQLDTKILPHIGNTPDVRRRKLIYIGHLINRLLLVTCGLIPNTDRDSLENKRNHTAGTTYTKAFKTQFNFKVVMPLQKRLKRLFTDTPFSKVNLEDVPKYLDVESLESAMCKTITAGTKEMVINNKSFTNRVHSQNMHRRNMMNVLSMMRNINTPQGSAAKQTSRAEELRSVNSTYLNYICIIQSAEGGEKVGTAKEMAVASTISSASNSSVLKLKLLEDVARIIPLDTILDLSDIKRLRYSKVFVNGDWIGCTRDSVDLIETYRQYRRKREIHIKTTIRWDEICNDVYFWTDSGRQHAPLVIVYNNREEYDKAVRAGKPIEFEQWIGLTADHIKRILSGTITFDELYDEGAFEFISAEEQLNCFLALDSNVLDENRHNPTMQYTHCQIPQALFGYPALASIYLDHAPGNRVAFETNHIRQTCSWYTLNFHYRFDKNVFFQYELQYPLVKTFTNHFIIPHGHNMIMAIAAAGSNQEDSLKGNQSSADRGLFSGMYLNTITTELEKNEEFTTPSEQTTMDYKRNASYEHLVHGFVREGTRIKNGDVFIGKVAALPKKTEENFTHIDRSQVYDKLTTAVVNNLYVGRNGEGKEFAKVGLRYHRPIQIGDKFTSRMGNKAILAEMNGQADMMYTATGLTPDAYLNCHAFPTRMVINQILESVSLIAAREGAYFDATACRNFNNYELMEEFAKYGIRYDGCSRCYDGRTGEWIDTHILIYPSYYQRIMKFIDDENEAIDHGATDVLTHQPLQGIHSGGSLRVGEMEVWVYCAHGSMMALQEKFSRDSDGFTFAICANCGNRAITNERKALYRCKFCKNEANIQYVTTSRTSILFMDTLNTANVGVTYTLTPFEEESFE